MGEDKRKIVSDCKIKKLDTDTDSLLTQEKFGEVENKQGRHESVAMEDSRNDGEKESGDSFPSNGFKLSEKENQYYSDKNVTECELPELMVCFKEAPYYAVKEVHKEAPSLEKILVENGEVHNEGIFTVLHSDWDVDSDLTMENETNPFLEYDSKTDIAKNSGPESSIGNGEGDFNEIANVDSAAPIINRTNPFVECDSETDVSKKSGSESLIWNGGEDLNEIVNVNNETPISNGTNPFVECDSETDVAVKSGSESSFGNGKGDFDEIMNVVPEEKTILETLLFMQELDFGNSTESSDLDGNGDHQQSDQGTSEEAHSSDSIMPSASEELNNCNQPNESRFNSKVESGSITYDFDSSLPETSGREVDSKDTDWQQSLQTLNMPSIEEETVDSLTASSRSFFIQHGYGESSFSAAGPLSGPISYSGPIPYSGSISLRSDSSTTSTRSFAFPILNSEWNSSPVKMAKADRRHFRKHRGWRLSLLCCRF